MSFDAKVFQVMIASPGDVTKERAVIREIINEWNIFNSFEKKIVLLPVGWETHTTPEMGYRPQAIINNQILANCDLLVGVFWTRIGTDTGIYESGTVEEITEHINSGKPAMLYFSETPISPSKIDHNQMSRVEALKTKYFKEGLVESYTSVENFKETFRRQLALKIQNNNYFQSTATTGDSSTSLSNLSPNKIVLNLSDKEKELLKKASYIGYILKLATLEGLIIQIGSENFVETGNSFSEALGLEVLELLIEKGLVLDRDNKGVTYYLTTLGYRTAEQIISI